MGVPWSDAGVVGELIGIKTFLNEFVAYKELAKFMDNRLACTGELISVCLYYISLLVRGVASPPFMLLIIVPGWSGAHENFENSRAIWCILSVQR
jgi:hypothetical protein